MLCAALATNGLRPTPPKQRNKGTAETDFLNTDLTLPIIITTILVLMKTTVITRFEDLTPQEKMEWAEWYNDPVRYEQLNELERVERIKYSKQ